MADALGTEADVAVLRRERDGRYSDGERTFISFADLARATGGSASSQRLYWLTEASAAERQQYLRDQGEGHRPRWLVATDSKAASSGSEDVAEESAGTNRAEDTASASVDSSADMRVLRQRVSELEARLETLRSAIHRMSIASKLHLDVIADLEFPIMPAASRDVMKSILS